MDSTILEYLKKEHGVAAPEAYYAVIDEWNAWRRGFYKPFHEFSETGASGFPVKRELYRLNMAKKICEDWAALIFGERTYVSARDDRTSEWLGGYDGLHGLIGSTGFMREADRLTEKAFALGSGAAILRLDNAVISDGRLRNGKDTILRFDFVDAQHIVPISVKGGKIIEAAFVSEIRLRGEDTVYIELHRLEGGEYVITNEWLRYTSDGVRRYDGEAKIPHKIRTGSRIPLFSVLTPNISNCIDENCGLGVSVFAEAIDCLKGVDLAYNNFCRDLKLGGKKVFLNRSLVMRDGRGVMYTPDDVAQQLFVTIGDGDITNEVMIKEHNPELRTGENADAVQHQLDYLSFRCGLGTRHYLFSGVQGKAQLTATQYTGEKQDLIQNTAHHRVNVQEFIEGAMRAAMWAGANIQKCGIDPDSELEVRFDDSYFIDSESERARDREEVAAGLMLPYEYRMKWRGESAESAKEILGRNKAELAEI